MAQISKRQYFTQHIDLLPLPNLIEIQLDSYKWFLKDGINELLDEISPIQDFTGKNLELHFLKHTIDKPKYSENEAKEKNITYEAPLRCQVQLINKVTGEVKEQEVFLGNLPMMTPRGTFIVNGVERVVISQIVRSPGVIFTKDDATGFFGAKIIPNRGAWLEIETGKKGVITVKVDRKRKVPITALLRAFGYGKDKDIIDLFKDSTIEGETDFVLATLERDPTSSEEEGLQAVYKRIRPGDLATPENAKSLLQSMFFDYRHYDIGRVGRYKINKRLSLKSKIDREHRVFQVDDLVLIIKEIVRLNNTLDATADDIDHLGNRRVRPVGELAQNKFRVGLLRTERICKDRMTVLDLETVVPTQLINSRPIIAAMREFFASSQLSQFMDQTNPLSELEHKRRLSATGPGGLTRERASFDVRDVHRTHYGRICPIATPEGPNIGLVVQLSTYAKINEHGFILTPYRKISQFAPNKGDILLGRSTGEAVVDPKTRKVLIPDRAVIGKKELKILSRLKNLKQITVRPYITEEINYYDADEETNLIIAQATVPVNDLNEFVENRVSARRDGEAALYHIKDLTHVDVSPKQVVSVSTSLIPFVEHDEGARALMGSNMQRQAVSLINPESPIVGTGMEGIAAVNSGQVVISEESGTVSYVDAGKITMITNSGKKVTYTLHNFSRSNQGTCIHQKPIVEKGEKIKKGQVIADGAATETGELALGRNLLVAYMPWQGGNFEDAILISERVIRDALYSSIHIEDYPVDVRDTKLGPETITRDIPNIGEDKLKDLDEDGIIRIGAQVKEGDILVGKITPKGETELTAEERLLRAIFGEKAREVKDTSLRMPGGSQGKVIGIKIFSRDKGDELPTGVIRQVVVSVAQIKRLQVGDKLAGRHGNKGVISRIVKVEDMPYLADGTPVDVVLNPLGVVSRMNIGQILEAELGRAVSILGYKVATPSLDGITQETIRDLQKKSGVSPSGKVQLFDGNTGDAFDSETLVGITYIMKLSHLVDDKIHARSIGPYSLVTQQPLGGKAQHGGQRFGEMEVWALEAYAAAYTLQEMLTIKSDDVLGRSKAYEAIVKCEPIKKPRTPESFNVLVRELESLGLSVNLYSKEDVPDENFNLNELFSGNVDAFLSATKQSKEGRPVQPEASVEKSEDKVAVTAKNEKKSSKTSSKS
ncbi:MAG: DNA-directed RNA polymerase subunit beta [Candidatus Abawacabacteria bacterium RBG_16_42_10]|uniref:DNA-directed RNA polymerase subunit beta n=1 Tax=Candidatus Abawacabacteria bacterium RBG_16_42_10 TaxID=1817814 RepID=A0A1F4XJW5_9BACT|nr:MAG: DNA-directed RNA polymerase subunit beta [Candidatus Abawacabacteria bacterium RBG_16_42_10]